MKKNLSTLINFFILPLLVFSLFWRAITTFLSKYLVVPLFSYVAPALFLYDIAVFVLFILACIGLYRSTLLRLAKVPIGWLAIMLTVAVIYLCYRIPEKSFIFTGFSFYPDIKLLDVVVVFVIFVLLANALVNLKKKGKKMPPNMARGFDVDEAQTIDCDNDTLNRQKFIETIIEKLENTTAINGSFPIGIMARWGSGKTTFINTLIERLDCEKWIPIDFNVWKCASPTQVVDSFFKLLRQQLDNYSFTLGRKLGDYTTGLLKGMEGENFGFIKNISDLFVGNSSLEQQYSEINYEIKKLNKKIIVVIDDLDRLDKREIYEVIRLIRNTANFTNTFFIAAYDRNYILSAIEEINPYQAHYFLEKIFQVEFALPPIPLKAIESDLVKRIMPILSEEDKVYFAKLKKEKFTLPDHGSSDLTSLFLHNFRDVVRFTNSFKLSYDWVRDEIYFPDFYNLELIRFKHPELFLDLYRHFSEFFTTEDRQHNRSSFQYSIKCEDSGESHLKIHLERTKPFHKLTDSDIHRLVSAYWSVFPPAQYRVQSRYYGVRSHLAVINPSKMERYFLNGIDGALSEVKFSKMRNMPIEQFKLELKKEARNEELLSDFQYRFLAIKDYDDKDDFEKILTAIFYFANLENPSEEKGRNVFIGFDSDALSIILGSQKTRQLYSNIEEYKSFLIGLLKYNATHYTYTDSFLETLSESNFYNVSTIFTASEIADLALNNFEHAITHSEAMNLDLWYKFSGCKQRVEEKTDKNTISVRYPLMKKAKQLMRQFIFEKDIDGYLTFAVERVPFEQTFYVKTVVTRIFNRPNALVYMLKKAKIRSKYKDEFLRFYDQLENNPEYQKKGVPFEFFKEIPVKRYEH